MILSTPASLTKEGVMRIKIFLFLIMFGLITSTIKAQNQYPPLTGRTTQCNTLSNACDIDLRRKSEVAPYNPTQVQLDEFWAYWNKFYQRDLRKDGLDSDGWYLYTYTFENQSKYIAKLNFSEWTVIHSPLTTIVQDFSITLNSGEVRIIKFFSPSKPNQVVSAFNAGLWEEHEVGKWEFSGMGQVGLYIPDRRVMFLEVK